MPSPPDLPLDVEQVIEDAITVCEIPAPTGDEGRRATWVRDRLSELGWTTHIDEVGNVVASLSDPRGGLLVAGHLDTVFDEDVDVRVRRDGTILHGPSIADNSLSVATLLHLARRVRVPGLVLVATVGEEALGNLRGALHAVDSLRPREMIALEGSGIDRPSWRAVGSVRFDLSVSGVGGHSWNARGVESAVHELVRLVGHVLHGWHSKAESCNVGEILGGSGTSAIATRAVARIEFRSHDADDLRRLREWIDGLCAGSPLPVTVSELGLRLGGVTADDDPLAVALQRELRVAGVAELVPASRSTDANAGMAAGIPAVCLGLADAEGMHSLSERVDVTRLPMSLRALEAIVVERLAGLEDAHDEPLGARG